VPHLHKEVSGEAQLAMLSVQLISKLLWQEAALPPLPAAGLLLLFANGRLQACNKSAEPQL
jgi:hypothetical protein